MNFYSTENIYNKTTFRNALFSGMPQDNGLYMPEEIPNLSKYINKNTNMTLQEVGYLISSQYIENELSNNDIYDIVEKSISFKAPNKHIYDSIYSLELFHGPTLAFKDFGARFMARCMEKFIINNNRHTNILVATSGDTGSAVAQGFYNVEGVNVIILYPKGKVSHIQEKQLTTLDKNIYALEVQGTFDDCQKLVKQAFLDSKLNKKLNLSSANSINIARLIPQSFYYISSYFNLQDKSKETIFCVPSGNFGNITAGLLSKKMGLPASCFIGATNLNKIVPDFFKTETYNPRESIQTISNAMDVGNPSNMNRIMSLYKNLNFLKQDMKSWYFDENETKDSIRKIYNKYKYLLDPHSAIGLLGIEKYLKNKTNDVNGIFLGTAHPAKFADVLEDVLQEKIAMPDSLAKIIKKKKRAKLIENNYMEFYDYLLNTFQ